MFAITTVRLNKGQLAYFYLMKFSYGDQAMQNVIVVTTFWDLVIGTRGAIRHQELESICGEVLEGCRFDQFRNSSDSAWQIINKSLERPPVILSTILEPRHKIENRARSEAKKHIHRLNQDKKASQQRTPSFTLDLLKRLSYRSYWKFTLLLERLTESETEKGE
jgi:hypothetical protein